MIQIKRAYDPQCPDDGPRFLVDRLWPRGIRKENFQIDGWLKEVAPSDELRRWFGHDPAKWEEFCCRYDAELENNSAETGSPWFSGHFPDAPILPGIAILSMVTDAITHHESEKGKKIRIASIRGVRFRLPVRPDELLMAIMLMFQMK